MESKDENKNKSRNSTVAISEATAKKLDRFCKQNGITKKEFVELSLQYFLKQGINPKINESPSAELQKIGKRIDQIFGFMKTQEQDFLRPLILQVLEDKKTTDKNFVAIAQHQKKILDTVIEEHKTTVSYISESQRQFSDEALKDRGKKHSEIGNALKALAQMIDEKNKSGLLGKFFG